MNDTALYTAVLFQMAQRFPSSHVSVVLPVTAGADDKSKPSSAGTTVMPDTVSRKRQFGGEKDVGFQMAQLRRRSGTVMIVGQVWPGSAASRAGITPGWLINNVTYKVDPNAAPDPIVHVTGSFTRLTLAQMHTLEASGTVQLVASAPSPSKEALQAKLKALQTSVHYDAEFSGPEAPFVTKRLASGVLYIRFDKFDQPTLANVTEALRTAGHNGVILDLRYNGGGYVIPLLNEVLPRNTPVYKSRDATGLHTISTGRWTRPYSGPLAVLTGPASASAAEITASVMKTRQRAVVIGRATNGSVLGCTFFRLPDGGQLQVAVNDIETIEGKRLENVGVTPDIEIYPGIDDIRAGRDLALETAERELLKGAHR